MHKPLAQHHRHRLIWLISLALLCAACLPSWASLLRGAQGGGWIEVCSVTGSRWVASTPDAVPTATKGSPSPADEDAGMNGASCPYCLLQHHAWAPPPVPALHLQPLPRAQAALATFYASVPGWDLWPSAHPRAPPVHA